MLHYNFHTGQEDRTNRVKVHLIFELYPLVKDIVCLVTINIHKAYFLQEFLMPTINTKNIIVFLLFSFGFVNAQKEFLVPANGDIEQIQKI